MFEDIFRRAMEEHMREQVGSFKSRNEAVEMIQKFVESSKPDLKIGDYVELNDFGKKRYSFPKANHAAVVTNLLPDGYIGDNGEGEDIVITVAVSPECIRVFSVNSKFYQKAGEKTNIFSFRKKL